MTDRQPPKGKVKWSQLSRTAVFWLLVILLPVAFYQILGSSREDFVEVPYSTFNRELERNNIVEVEITSGQLVRGEFKQSIPVEGERV
ncbi:MAG TPA: ATP-dependent metallopeptidase FtsH/Yme1/Tma family protein, partial [Gemmatimonadales bacterium]